MYNKFSNTNNSVWVPALLLDKDFVKYQTEEGNDFEARRREAFALQLIRGEGGN